MDLTLKLKTIQCDTFGRQAFKFQFGCVANGAPYTQWLPGDLWLSTHIGIVFLIMLLEYFSRLVGDPISCRSSGESLKSNLVQTLPMLFYKLSNAFLFTLQEMNEETYPTKREVQNIFENLQKCQFLLVRRWAIDPNRLNVRSSDERSHFL